MTTRNTSEKFMDTTKTAIQVEMPKSVITVNQIDSVCRLIGWVDESHYDKYVIHYTDGTTDECQPTF